LPTAAHALRTEAYDRCDVSARLRKLAETEAQRIGVAELARRLSAEAPLVQLSKLIAAHIDKLEVGRSTGQWANPEDLVGYSDKVEPEFMPTVGVLWKEFCAEIEDRRPLV
jgi:hypothetical protein